MNNVVPKTIAWLCMFLTLLNLGCGNSPQQQSKDVAAQIIAQSHQLNKTNITPQNLQDFANKIEQYVALAERDGSLAKSETTLRTRKDQMAPKVRQSLEQQHLKGMLLQAAADMRAMSMHLNLPMASNGVHLVTVSWRVIPVISPRDCETYEGGFLAIAAIGAVASLGGVNPLGDLLGAIGAVGAFGAWAACHRW